MYYHLLSLYRVNEIVEREDRGYSKYMIHYDGFCDIATKGLRLVLVKVMSIKQDKVNSLYILFPILL